MRLIVVSNRVACPKGDEPIDGGLAAALLPAVKTSGAIWVGASARLSDPGDKESFVKVIPAFTRTKPPIRVPTFQVEGSFSLTCCAQCELIHPVMQSCSLLLQPQI